MTNLKIKMLAPVAVLAVLGGGVLAAPAASAAETPTVNEILTLMATDEKLAHDVYTTLANEYGVRTFSNIARAESRHLDQVRTLMDTYGVTDITVGDAVGEFDNPDAQALYDDLIAQGMLSVTDAAKVGIAIEELDIADLQEAIDADYPADIDLVFSRLLAGSENHLTAFQRLENGGSSSTQGQGHGRR